MQTFVPTSESFRACAAALDRQRLGKQRVECLQILHALDPEHPGRGWVNHPAVKMWRGRERSLAEYGWACVEEWLSRGYKDVKCGPQLLAYIARFDDTALPAWWGDERVHRSHRSRLIQKMPEHYLPLWPDEVQGLDYYWPREAA